MKEHEKLYESWIFYYEIFKFEILHVILNKIED